jgi:hypothetical protein
MCDQSVQNIPTIVNGHLSVINQHLANINNNKWSYVRKLVEESKMKMQDSKMKDIKGLKHKILIIGDSHVRGIAGLMATSLDDRFEVCGFIKPGSGTVSLSGTMKKEVDKLTKNDFVVISSGSNDINKNDPRSAFRYIVDYMENVRHTNVILIGVPPRFDADASDDPYLNNITKHFNSKLRKLTKFFNVTMSEMVLDRLFHTRQGLHLNVLGKEIVANQLVSLIYQLLEKVKVNPITLEWHDKVTHNGVSKNTKSSSSQTSTCLTDKRTRRLPITRNEDFLWIS